MALWAGISVSTVLGTDNCAHFESLPRNNVASCQVGKAEDFRQGRICINPLSERTALDYEDIKDTEKSCRCTCVLNERGQIQAQAEIIDSGEKELVVKRKPTDEILFDVLTVGAIARQNKILRDINGLVLDVVCGCDCSSGGSTVVAKAEVSSLPIVD